MDRRQAGIASKDQIQQAADTKILKIKKRREQTSFQKGALAYSQNFQNQHHRMIKPLPRAKRKLRPRLWKPLSFFNLYP